MQKLQNTFVEFQLVNILHINHLIEKMRNFENLFFGTNLAKPAWISPFLTTDPDMCFKKEEPVKLPEWLKSVHDDDEEDESDEWD